MAAQSISTERATHSTSRREMVQIDLGNGSDPFNKVMIRLILIGWFLLQAAVLAFVIVETIRVA